jgi:hypothetical protein
LIRSSIKFLSRDTVTVGINFYDAGPRAGIW